MVRRRFLRALLGLALLVAPTTVTVRAAEPVVLDDFEDLEGWSTAAADGSTVAIAQEPGLHGNALRIDFELNPGGGWVVVRKAFGINLPKNYAFTFQLRGEAPRNNFEFKLLDPKGRNVWWRNQRDFAFPTDWTQMTIRRSRVVFASGAAPDRPLSQVANIEFAISSVEGGIGSVWIDDLTFEGREPAEPDGTLTISASSFLPDHEAWRMVDEDPASAWESASEPEEQWVLVDFRANREYGGLVIEWEGRRHATAYEVQTSNDGTDWTTAYTTTTGRGRVDYVYMPDAESRYIRLVFHASAHGEGYGIAALTVKPAEFSASPSRFFEHIARDAQPGTYPKYLSGRQSYWTAVGVSGDGRTALLNEEGTLEPIRGSFSIEPFLHAGGELITWSSVRLTQRLEDDYLPMPSVVWDHDRIRLTITAFATSDAGVPTVIARYRVLNRTNRGQAVDLFLTVRPFQVTPPWQSLNMQGGVTQIREIAFQGRTMWVDRRHAVTSVEPPDHVGVATFEDGSVTEFILADRVPPHLRVSDPFGFASGAMQYHLNLEPRGRAEFDLIVPQRDADVALAGADAAAMDQRTVGREFATIRRAWKKTLSRVEFTAPPAAKKVMDTLRTSLAYILIEREGTAIRPGPRNYARSWIRDGAVMSSALLAMGFSSEVRDFLRWYAQFQQPDGKIPCCVDGRGPDPVNEHDSPGAFIWTVAEHYRYTRDAVFVHEMWPHVVRAVDYMAALRARRVTPEYLTPEKQAFYGLLPESISHEGYSAFPVHSYWDDFFALRGLKDAADLAVVIGDEAHAASYAALRDDFRASLYASIDRVMLDRGIDYVPASVELGDFDPTSTSAAIAPGGELANLPDPALRRTFERYWSEVAGRLRGETDSAAHTPYEVRNVGTLLRLGEKRRALELLAALLADHRPAAWNGWAEVVWHDPGSPRFIGDMPHGWIAACFIRVVRALLVDEREADDAVVVGAGVPAEWISGEGLTVKRLPTYYGVMDLSMRREGADTVRVTLAGDFAVPPGGLVVHTPLGRPLRGVTVNGRPVEDFTADHVHVAAWPAEVVLAHEPTAP